MTDQPSPAEPTKIVLVVPQLPLEAEPATEEEFREEVLEGVRNFFGGRTEVDLSRVREQLEKVQEQVDALLTGLYERTVGAMKLSEVEIALSVTAEGGIGIATVGAEASITLVYSYARKQKT